MAVELKDLTKRADNYSQWYNDLVIKADLVGCDPILICVPDDGFGCGAYDQFLFETGIGVDHHAGSYSQWYNDLVIKADLAEQSAVRGCMVIKPYGCVRQWGMPCWIPIRSGGIVKRPDV